MSFTQAIAFGFSNYVNFSGRVTTITAFVERVSYPWTIQGTSALHTERRNDRMVIMEMRKPAGSVEEPEIRELTATEARHRISYLDCLWNGCREKRVHINPCGQVNAIWA
jgi:hypothetical protein